ncbi:MAG: hypothetical protein R3F37_18300 [Candidatus Competibacteraceae bacterium]
MTRVLEPLARCLTPEVAREIVKLQADSTLQERVDLLASKNTEGTLTAEERSEYESYVHATNFISILQAKARKLLNQNTVSQV